MINSSQAQTLGTPEKVVTPYGDEYALAIDGVEGRWFRPAHLEAIKETNDKLAAAQKTIAAQADEIASLKRQAGLEAKLDALNAQIIALKSDQLNAFKMLAQGQSDAIDNLKAIRGAQPTKTLLDSPWVKGGGFLAGFVANVKSIITTEPSPCATVPAASPKSGFVFRLDLNLRKR